MCVCYELQNYIENIYRKLDVKKLEDSNSNEVTLDLEILILLCNILQHTYHISIILYNMSGLAFVLADLLGATQWYIYTPRFIDSLAQYPPQSAQSFGNFWNLAKYCPIYLYIRFRCRGGVHVPCKGYTCWIYMGGFTCEGHILNQI